MDLDLEFPLKYCMNLGPRQDRRAYFEEEFLRQNLEVERFPAINARWVKHYRGMWDEGRYACGLTQRLIVRRARQLGAPAVLIFEDDVVLHENFRELAEAIELPDDWGIFYFGCLHVEKPERAGMGLVRVKRAVDLHAFAVRNRYYNAVIRAMTPPGKAQVLPTEPSDVTLAELHKEIPTYAAYPNLAWQRANESDLAQKNYSNYSENGQQRFSRDTVIEFEEEEAERVGSVFTQKNLKLNLGCGNVRLKDGWVNLEREQCDITELLPFKDEAARFIFVEHVIEHIDARSAYAFFKECLRVLEPEGVLRLAFPCIEQIWNVRSADYAQYAEDQGWGDGSQRSAIESLIFDRDHWAVWTAPAMRAVLESLGFVVSQEKIAESEFEDLRNLERRWKEVGRDIDEVETVCLDARKPVGWEAATAEVNRDVEAGRPQGTPVSQENS